MGTSEYGEYFPRQNFSAVTLLTLSPYTSLAVASDRIRSATGTWAKPLVKMPNMLHVVSLKASGD